MTRMRNTFVLTNLSLFLVTFLNTILMVYKYHIKLQQYIITKQIYTIFTTERERERERVTFFSHEDRHFYL